MAPRPPVPSWERTGPPAHWLVNRAISSFERNDYAEADEDRARRRMHYGPNKRRRKDRVERQMVVVVHGGMHCRRLLIDATLKDPGAKRLINVNKTGSQAASENEQTYSNDVRPQGRLLPQAQDTVDELAQLLH